jgi:flagellar hook-length control protein FliK
MLPSAGAGGEAAVLAGGLPLAGKVLPGLAALTGLAAGGASADADPTAGLDALFSSLDGEALADRLAAARDGVRPDGDFARLILAARLAGAEARTPDAALSSVEPTTLTALQPAAGEGRGSEQPAARHLPPLNTPLQHPDWNNDFANRIAWLANNRVQAAEIRLNPQHLGPIEIQVRLDGDQASLVFGTAHAQVRDAIEAALPRLREMFAAQGLDMGSVDVDLRDGGAPAFADLGREAGGGGNSHGHGDQAGEDVRAPGAELGLAAAPGAVVSQGLLDLFV